MATDLAPSKDANSKIINTLSLLWKDSFVAREEAE
jgi:hypothetical protein